MKKYIRMKENLSKDFIIEKGFYEKEDGTFIKPVDKGIDSIGLTNIDLDKSKMWFRMFKPNDSFRRAIEPYLEKEIKLFLKEGILEFVEEEDGQ